MRLKPTLLFFLLALILTQCSSSGKKYQPPYSGVTGELIIVIDDENWEGAAGEVIQERFYESVPGLSKGEYMFKLIQTNKRNFGTLLKTHRNVLLATIKDVDANEEPRFDIRKNAWAKEQLVFDFNVRTVDAFVTVFNEHADRIIHLINQEEQIRLRDKFNKQRNVYVQNQLIERHNLSLKVPRDYEIVLEKDNFIWLRAQMQKYLHGAGGGYHDINQNIFIYYQDYVDSTIWSLDNQLAIRDSLCQMHVPGPSAGSYMTTERVHLEPIIKETGVNNQYAVQVNGLWKLVNDFMGGPFISLSTYDEKRGRVVTVEGNVFAPKFPKREYVRELQAAIYSIEFVDETTKE